MPSPQEPQSSGPLILSAATSADLMTPNPVSIRQDVTVKEAAAFLSTTMSARLNTPTGRPALEYNPVSGPKSGLEELTISADSPGVGKSLVGLRLPPDFLVVLIARGTEYLVPGGGTTLAAGDTLLVLAAAEAVSQVRARVAATG